MLNKIVVLFFILIVSFLPAQAGKKKVKLTQKEIKAYENQCRQMISYLEGTVNFLGNPENPSSEKQIIINNSFLKIFKNDKVQVEDDLDGNRKVPLYKDVQAYLKDIVFFYKTVHFNFKIKQITHSVTSNGNIYFKVKFIRNLTGITVSNDTVENNQVRFAEINLNPVNNDLKIASIYTHIPNIKEQLEYWWNNLSRGWKNYFGKSILVYDTLPLNHISYFNDTSIVIETPYRVIDTMDIVVDSASYTTTPSVDTVMDWKQDTLYTETNLIYQVLKYLIKTRYINISENLDIFNLNPVNELSNLYNLNISNTLIDNLTPLQSLNKLEYLNISGTPVSDLSPLRYLISIKELEAAYTQIKSTEVIGYLSRLEILNISHTLIDTLQNINRLNNLQSLNLSSNNISTADSISGLKQLVNLNLANCPIKNIQALAKLSNLQNLNLDSTLIINLNPLSNLKNLTVLRINNTKVTSLKPLIHLTNLRYIYCNKTGVTGKIASDFSKENPNCQVIYNSGKLEAWWEGLPSSWKKIFSSYISSSEKDITIENLHRLLQIDSLDLSGRKNLYSIKPLSILSQVKYLNLSGTSISNLNPLKSLGNLRYLNLENTKVSTLKPLQSLKSLKEINIEHTMVSSLLPLFGNKHLKVIYADNSKVSFTGVEKLKKYLPECLVIYQTSKLTKWWKQLPGNWKMFFKKTEGALRLPSATGLQKLVNKKELIISGISTPLNLEVLTAFKQLRVLKINNIRISHASALEKLHSLKTLSITNSPFSETGIFSQMKQLVKLSLENTSVLNLTPLQNLENLKELNLSGTRVKSLKPIQYLRKLKKLAINNTYIRSLKYIGRLPDLEVLRCDHTLIRAKHIEEFKKRHPKTEVIYY